MQLLDPGAKRLKEGWFFALQLVPLVHDETSCCRGPRNIQADVMLIVSSLVDSKTYAHVISRVRQNFHCSRFRRGRERCTKKKIAMPVMSDVSVGRKIIGNGPI